MRSGEGEREIGGGGRGREGEREIDSSMSSWWSIGLSPKERHDSKKRIGREIEARRGKEMEGEGGIGRGRDGVRGEGIRSKQVHTPPE